MKKYTILLLIGIISFLGIQKVNAEALIQEELANGKVSVSISSDQGYMDTIDTTITVKGNVSIESFSWANSLSDMASKEYKIANDQKSIHIILASRAVNMMKETKTIELGTMMINGNSTTTYHLELSDFSYSNLDQEHNSASNLYTKDLKELTYQTSETTTPTKPEENIDPPKEEDTENNKEENNNNNNQEEDQKNNNSSNQQSTNQNQNTNSNGNNTQNEPVNNSEKEDQEKPEENETDENQEDDEEEENSNKSEENTEEKQENPSVEQRDDKTNNMIIYTPIVVIVVFALAILLIIALKHKK